MGAKLTIVVENTALDGRLAAEHGLSVHISTGEGDYLLDAAATPEAVAANADALDLDLSALAGVVISHGHPDHTGGLAAALAARPGIEVFAHRRAFDRRWSDRPGKPRRQIGWDTGRADITAAGAVFKAVDPPARLPGGLVLASPAAGPQPALDHFAAETPDGPAEDTFPDELFVMAPGQAGWVVVTGCCHRGLPHTLSAASRLSEGRPIRAVLGGLHLGQAPRAELEAAVAAIRAAGVSEVHPCHCTGALGTDWLREHLGDAVRPIGGGAELVF